jgi:hypothetical protein
MVTTSERYGPVGSPEQLNDYNYKHFWPKYFLADMWRTAKARGLAPGSAAPAFELASTDGDTVRLSDFAGRPVLLHFGSGT